MRRLYKILYVLSFAIFLFMYVFKCELNNVYCIDIYTALSFISFTIGGAYLLKSNSSKVDKRDVLLEICYLIFVLIVSIVSYIYNNELITKDIVYMYYYKLVLVAYIGLNIYTALLFRKNKE